PTAYSTSSKHCAPPAAVALAGGMASLTETPARRGQSRPATSRNVGCRHSSVRIARARDRDKPAFSAGRPAAADIGAEFGDAGLLVADAGEFGDALADRIL